MAGDGLELWGGAECTVNRVGDRYRDQLRATGHHERLEDLERMAGLGIRTIRFPVLWERVAPGLDGACDWAWSDARMAELDRLGMRPIVGLLHHGSGPAHTSLVDDAFPRLFERYAADVAARYPGVRDWTPINEPLTTARFSTLYGTWYPHGGDRALFWRAMVIQAEATIAAMRAIRRVNPAARLIQTDDLGFTTGDAPSQAVADYYNARRWLGWDLLAGRVLPGHPLWEEGAGHGLGDRLRSIADAPCPADLIGIDHYPTSDRHLTAAPEGGYHDAPALRTAPARPGGVEAALREASQRYRVPVAAAECHLGCTREEQLRWLRRTWDTAAALRREGVDVRAVTLWALFGTMDWDSLLTAEAHRYESGAFDVSTGRPRATAVAQLGAALAGVRPCPPVLDALSRQPGWWEHDARFGVPVEPATPGARVVAITDVGGSLPHAFAGACRLRGLPYALIGPADLARAVEGGGTWAVIDTTGTDAVPLIERCDRAGLRLAIVTDGAPGGASLAARALVVPVLDPFSPFDGDNMAARIERDLSSGAIVRIDDDRPVTPTYTPDLVRVVLDLLIDGECGLHHLTGGETLPLSAFARRLAEALGHDHARIVADRPAAPAVPAMRPRGSGMPPLATAIRTYAAERRR